MQRAPPLLVSCLGPAGETTPELPRFVFDGDLAGCGAVAGVVLAREPEARARELLQAGVPSVFLGEAALKDSSALGRLAAEFGPGRVGAYAAAARMEVSWALETVCNADFRFMMPSRCEPCWELLDGAGARTGTEAAWWLGEMSRLGAGSLLLRADVRDDTDLDVLAQIVAQCGERLWVGPLIDPEPALEDWIERASARRLVLPQALLGRVPGLLVQ
jgi:hypothetical protein